MVLANKLGLPFEKVILVGFLLLMLLFVLLNYYTFRTNQKQLETQRLVTHTNEVLLATERLLDDLFQAETGQRGYLLTGHKTFLDPYIDAIDSIEYNFKFLQQIHFRQSHSTGKPENIMAID